MVQLYRLAGKLNRLAAFENHGPGYLGLRENVNRHLLRILIF
jgi:hypothetical protein